MVLIPQALIATHGSGIRTGLEIGESRENPKKSSRREFPGTGREDDPSCSGKAQVYADNDGAMGKRPPNRQYDSIPGAFEPNPQASPKP